MERENGEGKMGVKIRESSDDCARIMGSFSLGFMGLFFHLFIIFIIFILLFWNKISLKQAGLLICLKLFC